MTWKPTNELRFVQKPPVELMSWDDGTTMTIPSGPPTLQQKWEVRREGFAYSTAFEWRDVPLTQEEEV